MAEIAQDQNRTPDDEARRVIRQHLLTDIDAHIEQAGSTQAFYYGAPDAEIQRLADRAAQVWEQATEFGPDGLAIPDPYGTTMRVAETAQRLHDEVRARQVLDSDIQPALAHAPWLDNDRLYRVQVNLADRASYHRERGAGNPLRETDLAHLAAYEAAQDHLVALQHQAHVTGADVYRDADSQEALGERLFEQYTFDVAQNPDDLGLFTALDEWEANAVTQYLDASASDAPSPEYLAERADAWGVSAGEWVAAREQLTAAVVAANTQDQTVEAGYDQAAERAAEQVAARVDENHLDISRHTSAEIAHAALTRTPLPEISTEPREVALAYDQVIASLEADTRVEYELNDHDLRVWTDRIQAALDADAPTASQYYSMQDLVARHVDLLQEQAVREVINLNDPDYQVELSTPEQRQYFQATITDRLAYYAATPADQDPDIAEARAAHVAKAQATLNYLQADAPTRGEEITGAREVTPEIESENAAATQLQTTPLSELAAADIPIERLIAADGALNPEAIAQLSLDQIADLRTRFQEAADFEGFYRDDAEAEKWAARDAALETEYTSRLSRMTVAEMGDEQSHATQSADAPEVDAAIAAENVAASQVFVDSVNRAAIHAAGVEFGPEAATEAYHRQYARERGIDEDAYLAHVAERAAAAERLDTAPLAELSADEIPVERLLDAAGEALSPAAIADLSLDQIADLRFRFQEAAHFAGLEHEDAEAAKWAAWDDTLETEYGSRLSRMTVAEMVDYVHAHTSGDTAPTPDHFAGFSLNQLEELVHANETVVDTPFGPDYVINAQAAAPAAETAILDRYSRMTGDELASQYEMHQSERIRQVLPALTAEQVAEFETGLHQVHPAFAQFTAEEILAAEPRAFQMYRDGFDPDVAAMELTARDLDAIAAFSTYVRDMAQEEAADAGIEPERAARDQETIERWSQLHDEISYNARYRHQQALLAVSDDLRTLAAGADTYLYDLTDAQLAVFTEQVEAAVPGAIQDQMGERFQALAHELVGEGYVREFIAEVRANPVEQISQLTPENIERLRDGTLARYSHYDTRPGTNPFAENAARQSREAFEQLDRAAQFQQMLPEQIGQGLANGRWMVGECLPLLSDEQLLQTAEWAESTVLLPGAEHELEYQMALNNIIIESHDEQTLRAQRAERALAEEVQAIHEHGLRPDAVTAVNAERLGEYARIAGERAADAADRYLANRDAPDAATYEEAALSWAATQQQLDEAAYAASNLSTWEQIGLEPEEGLTAADIEARKDGWFSAQARADHHAEMAAAMNEQRQWAAAKERLAPPQLDAMYRVTAAAYASAEQVNDAAVSELHPADALADYSRDVDPAGTVYLRVEASVTGRDEPQVATPNGYENVHGHIGVTPDGTIFAPGTLSDEAVLATVTRVDPALNSTPATDLPLERWKVTLEQAREGEQPLLTDIEIQARGETAALEYFDRNQEVFPGIPIGAENLGPTNLQATPELVSDATVTNDTLDAQTQIAATIEHAKAEGTIVGIDTTALTGDQLLAVFNHNQGVDPDELAQLTVEQLDLVEQESFFRTHVADLEHDDDRYELISSIHEAVTDEMIARGVHIDSPHEQETSTPVRDQYFASREQVANIGQQLNDPRTQAALRADAIYEQSRALKTQLEALGDRPSAIRPLARRAHDRAEAAIYEAAAPLNTEVAKIVQEIGPDIAGAIKDAKGMQTAREQLLHTTMRLHDAAVTEEVARQPEWLQASMGARPDNPREATRYDKLAGELAAHRLTLQITNDQDLGLRPNDVSLQQRLAEYQAGADLQLDVTKTVDVDFGQGM